MEHHIMLLFLSDVKVDRALGEIQPVEYQGIGQAKTTNESAVRYLLKMGYEGKPVKLSRMFLFASNLVRKEIFVSKDAVYRDKENRSWTHLAYFKERLKDIIPDIESVAGEVYLYDEEAPIADAMQMVLDMAECIRLYVDQLPLEDRVILHADCTGGLRHANIMMLAVMRLMQYQRIDIGKVLYSRFYRDTNTGEVQEAGDIYHLFDLVAGAEEFVRFGSVSAILDYYGKKKVSPELGNLLSAMRCFAEEIRLCRYGSFTRAIHDLRRSLLEFQSLQEKKKPAQHSDELLNNQLMEQLQGRVQLEYGRLLDDELDDIELIRWCLKHDYLQQAMTLYTERVPEVICRNGLVFPATEDEKACLEEAVQRDILGRSSSFYMINEYGDNEQGKFLVEQRKCLEVLLKKVFYEVTENGAGIDYLEEVCGEFFHKYPYSSFFDAQAVREMFTRLCEIRDDPVRLKNIDEKDIVLGKLLSLYRREVERQFKNSYEKKNGRACTESELSDFWDKAFGSVRFGKQRYKKIVTLFSTQAESEVFPELFSDITFEYAYRMFLLIEKGRMQATISWEKLRGILNAYGTIKGERNHSNHAKLDFSDFTAESLQKYMLSSLNELDEVCKNTKGRV